MHCMHNQFDLEPWDFVDEGKLQASHFFLFLAKNKNFYCLNTQR